MTRFFSIEELPVVITLSEYNQLKLSCISTDINKNSHRSDNISQEGVVSALCNLLQESSELKLIIEGYRDNLYSPYNDFSKYDIDQARKHRDMPGLDIEDIVRAAARTREGLVPLIEKASQKPCLPETKCKLQTIQRNWEMCRGGLQSMQSIQDKRKHQPRSEFDPQPDA